MTGLRCAGLVEDERLRQPELIFRARCELARDEVAARVDGKEHRGLWSTRATGDDVEAALPAPELTPVAVASLLLWGRLWLPDGPGWFTRLAPRPANP